MVIYLIRRNKKLEFRAHVHRTDVRQEIDNIVLIIVDLFGPPEGSSALTRGSSAGVHFCTLFDQVFDNLHVSTANSLVKRRPAILVLMVDHVFVVMNVGFELIQMPLLSGKVGTRRTSGKAGVSSADFLVSAWMLLAVVLFLGRARDDVGRKAIMIVLMAADALFQRLLELDFMVVFTNSDTSMTQRVTRWFKVSTLQKKIDEKLKHPQNHVSSLRHGLTRKYWP